MTSAAVLLFVSACADEEPRVVSTDPCASIIESASKAREVDGQIALLDKALVVCRTADAFDRALARHAGAIGVEPAQFVSRRCGDPPSPQVELSLICRGVRTETTTTSVVDQVGDEVYAGLTLEGRTVEITSNQTLFREGRPATIVQLVDIGTEDGCPGVELEYRRWMILVDDPDAGDEASVYAQHALNVLRALGCPAPN
jgi:hypothetical protein